MAKKTTDLEPLVLGLLKEKTEISVPDVAQITGLSKSDEGDRKAIRRVFKRLVERGLLEARGAARARVYAALKSTAAEPPVESASSTSFHDIPLSRESEVLLEYASQSLQARAPIGYKQDFLHFDAADLFKLIETEIVSLHDGNIARFKIRPSEFQATE